MTVLATASTSKIANNAMNVLDKTPRPLGISYSVWETIAVKLMFAGAVLGILALAASLASSFILYLTSGNAKAETDRKVSEAHDTGLEAGERAGHAQAGVDTANVELAKQQTLTAQANAAAAVALEGQERLKKANLDLEAAVSPRILEQGLTSRELSKYAGVSFVVLSPSDFEPKRTAGQIRWMLHEARWKLSRDVTLRRPPAFFDGVVVHGPVGPGSEQIQAVIDALVKTLNDNGIVARSGFPMDDLGPSGVVVLVGPKPLPKSLQLNPNSVPADAHGNKTWGNILE
jgi:hypothetical protein